MSPLACACPGNEAGGAGTPGHNVTRGDLTPPPRAPNGCNWVPSHCPEHPHGVPHATGMLGVLASAAPQCSESLGGVWWHSVVP